MKKFLFRLISVICVTAALFLGAVIALNEYLYKDAFPMGVWINNVYCTGMTATEVSQLLETSFDLHSKNIDVRTLDGEVHSLQFDEYGIGISYDEVVARCLEEESGKYKWLAEIAFPRMYNIQPEYTFDRTAIEDQLNRLEWLNEQIYNSKNTVSIEKSVSDGYILVDETRDLLLKKDAVELICTEFVNQLTDRNDQFVEIDLSSNENKKICYKSIPYTSEMKETLLNWKGIDDFQSFHLTYVFGDQTEIIDKSVVSDWMLLDDQGNIVFENNKPILDQKAVEAYVKYLSDTYNTVGVEREFKATRGDVITVPGGSYGNKIDEKAEYEFLLDAFEQKKGGTRVPQYISEAKEKGLDDIGDTYIEVDMGNQHMYYYVEGELTIDTPIVTGNTSRRWGTPSKVCYVYFKQRNRILRGANYATPVKYWMAVDGHIGIHDATWRKEFGGEIYKTNGSHGCINTPLEIMTELYELVEIGTPVIMFY